MDISDCGSSGLQREYNTSARIETDDFSSLYLLSLAPPMATRVLSLVFLWPAVAAFLCDYADDGSLQRNTYLPVPVLSSLSGLGLSTCELKCRNVTGSLAFNYFRPDGKCECLGTTSASSLRALESRNDWHHGAVANSSQVPSMSCTCADGFPCILDMPALIRCPYACPPPPPMNDSTAHVTARYPTAAASYTCLEDFTFFGKSSHVTCTSQEAEWKGLNGSCKRTSWSDLTSRELVIPEPVQAQWSLETVLKITATDVAQIDLYVGNWVRMVVSMRVNYYGRQHYTVLDDHPSTPVFVNGAPWRTGMVYNVIILLNCPTVGFQVFVNGTYHGAYGLGSSCLMNKVLFKLNQMQVYKVNMVYH